MLYETTARASEIVAINVDDLDLEQRRAPVRSKGGDSCTSVRWRAQPPSQNGQIWSATIMDGIIRRPPITAVLCASPSRF
jgi:hypothetical protein